jgi:signal transduction histidine kinase/ligand-binding sensor domain-containing protein
MMALCGALAGSTNSLPDLLIRPAVTNGLVHFWPNLWDALDEISGQSGFIMGILPEVEPGTPDETPFGDETGWVQLPVRLHPHDAFTLTAWFRAEQAVRPASVVLGLHFGDDRWRFGDQSRQTDTRYGIEARGIHPVDSPRMLLPPETWLHLAITRSETGRLTLWKDGEPQATGTQPFLPDNSLDWITAGNDIKGDRQWAGQLRDLALFNRVLSQDELRALHATGPSPAPDLDSAARRAAGRRSTAPAWSTNVVRRSINEMSHRRFTAEAGLPSNSVQCLLQTSDGYLWIGTDMGVARFDGRSFLSFTEDDTPALREIGADVLSLAEDDEGTLWAGVYGGLLRIRGTEIVGITNGLPERFLLQVVPDKFGALWIAGFRTDRHARGPCRVRRFHPETGETSAQMVVPGHVRRLVPTTDGLWLVTEDPAQLLFWDLAAPAPTVVAKLSGPPLTLHARMDANLPTNLQLRGWQDPTATARSVIEMSVGDGEAVFHWLSPIRRAPASVSLWTAPGNPSGWVGAQTGLARFESGRLEQIAFGGSAFPLEVVCIAPNREGGVWLGTAIDGLHLVQDRLVRVWTTRDGLSGNDVRSVVATGEGTLLVGGPGGLDELRDGHWSRLGLNQPLPLDGVVSLAQDLFSTVWIGAGHYGMNALQYLRQDTALPVLLPSITWMHPTSLTATPRGRLWAACNFGLTWIEPNAPLSNPGASISSSVDGVRYGRIRIGDALPDVRFLKLLPDANNSLWVGTSGSGLLRIIDEEVETLTVRDGLPSDTCVPAFIDDTGALWITSRNAVARREKNGRIQIIRHEQGIPNDQFLDLIEDDHGHFWLPGQRGIHRLVRAELESFFEGLTDRVQRLTLGVREGMITPACTTLHYPITAKTSDGRIWVATRCGVASIDPASLRLDTEPLSPSIEAFVTSRNRTITPVGLLAPQPFRLLPGSGQRIEFYFTATSLIAADRVRFQYRLENHDPDWSSETDRRFAFYTNVKPGYYVFRVKAANAHGIWTDKGASVAFVIAPYLWQRRTFQTTVLLAGLTVGLLLHRQRLTVLKHLQDLRYERAFTAEKERIAADMHDDLGAALTEIAILGEAAKTETSPTTSGRSVLDQITQSARDAAARMSDLVWATNPKNDTLDNLAAYLREQAARQLENCRVSTTLRFPDQFPQCRVSATFRRNLLMAVKEMIHNAIKHGSPTSVLVELTIHQGQLYLLVEDDGRGFDPATRTLRGNGLVNLKRRIEELGGSLHIASAPGAGTRVHSQVPLYGLPSPDSSQS